MGKEGEKRNVYRYLFTDGNACVYTCRACCTLIQLFNRALSMVTKSALPFFKHTARASIQGILVGMYIYFLLPYLFHPEAELTSHGNDVKTTVPSSAAAATTLQSILPACILDRIVRKCVQRESMTTKKTCNKSRAGAKKKLRPLEFQKRGEPTCFSILERCHLPTAKEVQPRCRIRPCSHAHLHLVRMNACIFTNAVPDQQLSIFFSVPHFFFTVSPPHLFHLYTCNV